MKPFFSLFSGIVVFIACVLFLPPSSIGQTPLKLTTLEWEPYIGAQLRGQGYVAQLVKLAFATSEYDVKLSFFPWARTIQMARENEYAGYLPEYYSEEVAKDFIFSDPFPGGELSFFKRKDDTINYSSLQDLTPYIIGVVRGYVNTPEFDEATYLTKEEASDDLQNLRKLLGNRVDLIVADRYVVFHLMRTYLSDRTGEVDYIDPPLAQKQLYLCISKNHPNAQAILASFNAGLKIIRQDGSLLRLIEKSFLHY
ncbi:ABC transporter substrate-binding protein [Desulfopila sp. IMCC35008]|uniref:substrate-binding periplasmic protein n=1 Tax=Desulfopila sp. IMCC35008 TaxID=2653858 RepID=UPI0013D6413E|nr:transporter substrate-binding domain-containing protein [Desulfopila sp. IMCC35008]